MFEGGRGRNTRAKLESLDYSRRIMSAHTTAHRGDRRERSEDRRAPGASAAAARAAYRRHVEGAYRYVRPMEIGRR